MGYTENPSLSLNKYFTGALLSEPVMSFIEEKLEIMDSRLAERRMGDMFIRAS